MAHLALAGMFVLPIACGDDDGGGSGERTCGDGTCDVATCESVVRCPEDCGNCIGADCMAGGPNGSCGQPCESSCDCASQGELCTKDYGLSSAICIPTICLGCSTLENCSYNPDADGVCAVVTC
jgi:hypothetical protein